MTRASLRGRLLRYVAAGVLATGVYLAVVSALVVWVEVGPVAAAVAATVVVIVTSYAVNRRFVFSTDRSHRSAFARFVIASLLSIALNAGLMHLATTQFGWRWLAGAVLTTLIVPPVNFVVNYRWTFRPTGDGA